ncbi:MULTISPECIES: CBO0543 family protein [Neobacillus]|uniref:CBO0543 family protein n=1 Tax=Neobacillus TaxID=2675232 RepID=UPI00360C6B22
MLHTVVSYLRFALPFLYLLGSWRWGDWRNWKEYYPTILFFVTVNFFISIIMYEYPLWTYKESFFIPNHTIVDFIIAFLIFPQMAFIFLSKYPFQASLLKQIGYASIWVIFGIAIESLFKAANLISYDHGWNFWWSLIVWIFMFFGLRLHHTRPILAWFLCFACTIFLILYFHIPITKYK